MGLTTWENAPDGKILKTDVTVAKNYLSREEMTYMERIVTLYLDYAELQAERRIPMSMEDWATRLDGFLEFNGNEILTGPGKIRASIPGLSKHCGQGLFKVFIRDLPGHLISHCLRRLACLCRRACSALPHQDPVRTALR